MGWVDLLVQRGSRSRREVGSGGTGRFRPEQKEGGGEELDMSHGRASETKGGRSRGEDQPHKIQRSLCGCSKRVQRYARVDGRGISAEGELWPRPINCRSSAQGQGGELEIEK
jgi:hypothetical protein